MFECIMIWYVTIYYYLRLRYMACTCTSWVFALRAPARAFVCAEFSFLLSPWMHLNAHNFTDTYRCAQRVWVSLSQYLMECVCVCSVLQSAFCYITLSEALKSTSTHAHARVQSELFYAKRTERKKLNKMEKSTTDTQLHDSAQNE